MRSPRADIHFFVKNHRSIVVIGETKYKLKKEKNEMVIFLVITTKDRHFLTKHGCPPWENTLKDSDFLRFFLISFHQSP